MKATFEADFSNFNSEVEKSVAKMKSLSTEANQVNVDMNKWVTEFSGQHIVDEANAMGLALTAIGGASKLTDAELQKVAATTAAAADRFLAFGKEVPPTMQTVIQEIKAAQKAAAEFKTEVDSWGPALIKAKEAQGILRQGSGAGVGLATEVQGMLSGATGGGLQVLVWKQIAEEVWQIGKGLADWAQQEHIIPDMTAKLLGFGDVAQQVADANLDALAKASALVGRDVTSMSEALRINTEEQKRNEAAAKAANDARFKAMVDEAKQIQADYRDIEAQQRRLSAELSAIEKKRAEDATRAAQEELAIRTKIVELESGERQIKPGALGFSRYEQEFTQKGLAASGASAAVDEAARQRVLAARGLAPTGESLEAAALMAPFTDLAKSMKALDLEVKNLTEETGSAVLAMALTEGRRQEAMQKFTDSMMKAAKANDDWIKSLTPRVGQGMFAEGESILPWSTLGPKPIAIKPIGPYGAGVAAGGVNATVQVSGVLDPRTINELAAAVSKAIMAQLGRPTPNA